MKSFTLVLILISLIQSCTKDKLPNPKESDCFINYTVPAINNDTSYTLGCPVMFEVIHLNKYEYGYPVFNPNNKYEIAYLRKDTESQLGWNDELWTFNFCTGQTKYLTDKAGYSVDWSAKDWLIFTGKDRQIWKIKSNGDSLTQLTNQNGYNNHPKWNDEGSKYIYRWSGYNGGLIIADEHGKIVDTLKDINAGRWNWNSSYLSFALGDGNGGRQIKLFDFESNTQLVVDSYDFDGINSFIIHNTILDSSRNILFWNMSKEIGYTQVSTSERIIIHTGATNRRYTGMDVSSDGKTILLNRNNTRKITDCLIETESLLYLLDSNGENERLINIPE